MSSRTKMALSFRKAQTQKTGYNFLFAGGRHLISYFCFIIILADVNFAFSYLSEIKITVKGTGKQKILYSSFELLPNETLVNGVPQNRSGIYVDNLVDQTNIITLRWNYQVTTCKAMFVKLINIISIDLSNFDTSKVESLEKMFEYCESLKSINLNNVNTSSAKNMELIFYECIRLETLNLSSFDTSKVTNMQRMFALCS